MPIPRVLAALLIVTPLLVPRLAAGQAAGVGPLVDCTPSGRGAECRIALEKDQRYVPVEFRLATPYLGSAPLELRARVLPSGSDIAIERDAENPALYRLTHRLTTDPADTVRILVQSVGLGVPLSDTIHLIPPPTARQVRTEPQNYAPFVWLRESWIPLTIHPEIVPVDGPALTPETCEQIRFAYQPRGGGTAQPDTGSARWVDERCLAETRWKLGDAAGEQQLRLVVGGDERTARETEVFRANARQTPRIVVGVAHYTRHEHRVERFCAAPDTPEAQCKETRFGADTVKLSFEETEASEQAFFAVDFPVILRAQPTGFRSLVSERLRLTVGSTFVRPQDNAFVGLTLLPLLEPATEGFPVQLHAGWRINGGYVFGGSIDGTALIKNVLTALGAPL